MDAAFDRLTKIQQNNVNKQMFVFAYECVAKSRNEALERIIDQETVAQPHLRADLVRYCRLVQRVM